MVFDYLNPSFWLIKPHRDSVWSHPSPSFTINVNLTRRCCPTSVPASEPSPPGNLVFTPTAFYQIPLAWGAMKYCGICTPFKGIRVYHHADIGIPSPDTPLEELMCCVLGDLIALGSVADIDDVYIGCQSPNGLLHKWKAVVFAMDKTVSDCPL